MLVIVPPVDAAAPRFSSQFRGARRLSLYSCALLDKPVESVAGAQIVPLLSQQLVACFLYKVPPRCIPASHHGPFVHRVIASPLHAMTSSASKSARQHAHSKPTKQQKQQKQRRVQSRADTDAGCAEGVRRLISVPSPRAPSTFPRQTWQTWQTPAPAATARTLSRRKGRSQS